MIAVLVQTNKPTNQQTNKPTNKPVWTFDAMDILGSCDRELLHWSCFLWRCQWESPSPSTNSWDPCCRWPQGETRHRKLTFKLAKLLNISRKWKAQGRKHLLDMHGKRHDMHGKRHKTIQHMRFWHVEFPSEEWGLGWSGLWPGWEVNRSEFQPCT